MKFVIIRHANLFDISFNKTPQSMQQLTPSKVDKMYIYKFAPNYLKKKLHNQSRNNHDRMERMESRESQVLDTRYYLIAEVDYQTK